MAPSANTLPVSRYGNIFHVDNNAELLRKYRPNLTSPLGSADNPFQTVQGALNEIYNRKDASKQNPYYVHLPFGIVREALIVRSPWTYLVGKGGYGGTIIMPPDGAGPAILITEATLASIAAWRAANGDAVASADTAYTQLVHDSEFVFPGGITYPTAVCISGVMFTRTTENRLGNICFAAITAADGIDNGALSNDADKHLRDCSFDEGIYLRNQMNWVLQQNHVRGITIGRNVRSLLSSTGYYSGGFRHKFDAAEPSPPSPYDALGIVHHRGDQFGGSACYLQGAMSATLEHSSMGRLYVEDTSIAAIHTVRTLGLDQSDDSNVTCQDATVDGAYNVVNPGTLSGDFYNSTITGAVSLATGGTKTINFRQSRYYGALTDPDASLSLSDGSGSAIVVGGAPVADFSELIDVDFSTLEADTDWNSAGDKVMGDYTAKVVLPTAATALAIGPTHGGIKISPQAATAQLLHPAGTRNAPHVIMKLAQFLAGTAAEGKNAYDLAFELEFGFAGAISQANFEGLLAYISSQTHAAALAESMMIGTYSDANNFMESFGPTGVSASGYAALDASTGFPLTYFPSCLRFQFEAGLRTHQICGNGETLNDAVWKTMRWFTHTSADNVPRMSPAASAQGTEAALIFGVSEYNTSGTVTSMTLKRMRILGRPSPSGGNVFLW